MTQEAKTEGSFTNVQDDNKGGVILSETPPIRRAGPPTAGREESHAMQKPHGHSERQRRIPPTAAIVAQC